MDALDALIDAVEAGRDNSELWFPALGDHGYKAMQSHHGSLDAALALHEAILPGWAWSGGHSRGFAKGYSFEVNEETYPDIDPCEGLSVTPARAWLLAILRAYRAMQPPA